MICPKWSRETGCEMCADRDGCRERCIDPLDNATAREINELVDDGVLPESDRREPYLIGEVVCFPVCSCSEDKRMRLTIEIKDDDCLFYELEGGDLVRVTMREKR